VVKHFFLLVKFLSSGRQKLTIMKPIIVFTILLLTLFNFAEAQSWSAVGTGIKMEERKELEDKGDEERTNGTVYALLEYKGELYAGGNFKIAGGKVVNNIARWNGKEWFPVGAGIEGNVTSFCIYKDELYVGGGFTKAGETSATNIAKWNGESWSSVGGGTDSDIEDLAVYKDELYAAGDFTQAGPALVKHIAKWNGTTWTPAGHGVHTDLYSLVEFGGELHAGGAFVAKAGEVVFNLFKWNGKRWAGEGDFDGLLAALTVHDGKLIAGGHFGKVSDEQLSFVAQHDEKVWHPIGTGIGSHTPLHHVSALLSTGSRLYAAGGYKLYLNDDHREANNIAQWDGKTWTNLGKGVNGDVYSLALYQGEVYVGGSFSVAGGAIVSNAIAKWKP
jgi:hypothetical protein